MVKKLTVNREIELVKDYKIRTHISRSESVTMINKKRVFSSTAKHFTDVFERELVNDSKHTELYYKLVEDREIPLNTYRLLSEDKNRKQVILDGLLEILLLVSEGKIYDIELNPLNFIAEIQDEIQRINVKAFYRRDRGLREITDKWLNDAKKLIGYFLISDTGYNELNYNDLSVMDMYKGMDGAIAEQYLKIMRSSSVDQMAKHWFKDSVYRRIKGFPPIVPKYKLPKDITSGGLFAEDDVEVEFDQLDEKKEEGREGKKGTGIWKWFGILGGWLFAFIFGWMLLSDTEGELVVSEDYYKGLISYVNYDFGSAVEFFGLVKDEYREGLTSAEEFAIFMSYLRNGDYNKALALDSRGADLVVDYLEKVNRLEEVKNIDYLEDVILFEKAVLEDNYQEIVMMKDMVKRNSRRDNVIVRAYVMQGDVRGAVDFIRSRGMKGMSKKVKGYYKDYKEANKISKDDEKRAKKAIEGLD